MLKSLLQFNQHNRDAWVAAQASRIPEGRRILDVGAGPGRYRHLFAHGEYRAHDFGREPGTIGQYTKLDYESDITAIPVPDGSFDAILCTEVLEHVPDPVRALREMARILRPGGRVILTAPLGSFLHQEPFHFYGGYTPHWYRKFLPECGFQEIQVEPNEGFFSWFGQETQRFSSLLAPWRTGRAGWRWPFLTLIWLVTLPGARLFFPLLGRFLDRAKLESIATVGYHVTAVKGGARGA
ncbi:MAG TPA: class I SAM-dependent methyltransferase [Planctomycetota bacterium]|nr:class I SAM-dependent methyltransferase [Planctomycetota bacterium]